MGEKKPSVLQAASHASLTRNRLRSTADGLPEVIHCLNAIAAAERRPQETYQRYLWPKAQMGGQDAVAGFRASLGDLRKLFSQTSEAADNAQKAQQAREASDAEAVREGAKALELEARREALETALSAARKDAKAQKGRADAAEAALKKLQAQAKPEAKGTTARLTAETVS